MRHLGLASRPAETWGLKSVPPPGKPSRVSTSALRSSPSCPFPTLELPIHAGNDFHMQKNKATRTAGFPSFPPFPGSRTRTTLLPPARQQLSVPTAQHSTCTVFTVFTSMPGQTLSSDLSTDPKGRKHLAVATDGFCTARIVQPSPADASQGNLPEKANPVCNLMGKTRPDRKGIRLFFSL